MVVHPDKISRPEQKAIEMLLDEVEARAHLRWEATSTWPTNGVPVIALAQSEAWQDFAAPHGSSVEGTLKPEGFQIRVQTAPGSPAVCLIGKDSRGVLYAVGYLLRHLDLVPGAVSVRDDLRITASPAYHLRGHQLGYRPKTNSYDAWDLRRWEQYFRDLVVFGANAIELIPPRSDDAADSPHFHLPPMEMMTAMDQLADEYGLDVWVWYPAMDRDYADRRTLEASVQEWRRVLERLPRLDAVFVPGGDPGHTRPRVLMELLQQQAASLREIHPAAGMWVSPQGFDREWLDEFLTVVRDETPNWLSGIVYGPQIRISLADLRAAVPARYPIRHYPDITHSRQCQYPVPDWDTAFAVTEGRECINPRPIDEAAIFRATQAGTLGFLTYSEGCNDDVNKAVWSALGWDPDQDVLDVLREYSRYFIGASFTEGFAQGLLALERNWRGPLAANSEVETTLQQFQSMEKVAPPALRSNWRFQQGLFRAYYDAYTRRRLLSETTLETEAMDRLRDASRTGSDAAMNSARSILDRATAERPAPELRARIFELAEALFQSIGMQLSVPRYQAIAIDRGASLDTIDFPLNNRPWLLDRFTEIAALPGENERLQALRRIVNWTNPGPGGFYDDLGNPARQARLVRGQSFAADPASLVSSKTGFEEGDDVDGTGWRRGHALRYSWIDHAESLNDEPLQLHYTGLDRSTQYRLRVVYGGDSPRRPIRLVAGPSFEIHPYRPRLHPYEPVEFDIPRGATAHGELNLTWTRQPGLGGNGRGCQVAEVWLLEDGSNPIN